MVGVKWNVATRVGMKLVTAPAEVLVVIMMLNDLRSQFL